MLWFLQILSSIHPLDTVMERYVNTNRMWCFVWTRKYENFIVFERWLELLRSRYKLLHCSHPFGAKFRMLENCSNFDWWIPLSPDVYVIHCVAVRNWGWWLKQTFTAFVYVQLPSTWFLTINIGKAKDFGLFYSETLKKKSLGSLEEARYACSFWLLWLAEKLQTQQKVVQKSKWQFS